MGYKPAYLNPYDKYMTEELLHLFVKSTTDFNDVLVIIRNNLDSADLDYDTEALYTLIKQIRGYISQEKNKIHDLLNILENSTVNSQFRRAPIFSNVIQFYPPTECTINMLLDSINGYQKTLLAFIEQLMHIFAEK